MEDLVRTSGTMTGNMSATTEREQQLQELFETKRKYLLRVAYKAGAKEEVEDVVQEAQLRAWRGRDQWRGEVPALAWLSKIVYNVALEWRRGGKLTIQRQETVQLDNDFERPDERQDQRRDLMRQQMIDVLMRKVNYLTPASRIAIRQYLEEVPYSRPTKFRAVDQLARLMVYYR